MNRLPAYVRTHLNTQLSRADASAISALASGNLARPIITDETKASLIASGNARETLGGVVLTDSGMINAAPGR